MTPSSDLQAWIQAGRIDEQSVRLAARLGDAGARGLFQEVHAESPIAVSTAEGSASEELRRAAIERMTLNLAAKLLVPLPA